MRRLIKTIAVAAFAAAMAFATSPSFGATTQVTAANLTWHTPSCPYKSLLNGIEHSWDGGGRKYLSVEAHQVNKDQTEGTGFLDFLFTAKVNPGVHGISICNAVVGIRPNVPGRTREYVMHKQSPRVATLLVHFKDGYGIAMVAAAKRVTR